MKKLSEIIESYRVDRPDEWTMDALKRRAEALEAERDALAAQINLLRLAVLSAVQKISGGQTKADLRDAYDATPEQCLAEIKAEAVKEFAEWAFDTCPNIDCMFDDKDDYIARLRSTGTWLRDENVNGGKRRGGAE